MLCVIIFQHSKIKHKKAYCKEFCVLSDKFNTTSKSVIIKKAINFKFKLKDNLNDNEELQSIFRSNKFIFSNKKSCHN